MKAFLGIGSLKVFAKALRLLARTGNELYFEATKEGLILRVVNQSKTCFTSITFGDHFFLSYQLTGSKYEDNHCRISVRPMLQALKNIKNVENCQIRLDSGTERLIVTVTKPKGKTIQSTITILEHENLENYEPSTSSVSTIIVQPSVMSDLLNNLSKDLREVSFNISKQQFEITNYITNPDEDVQTVRLKYKLDPSEFTSYDVVEDRRLILSLQDFLSIVEFAETSCDELKFEFTKNGKPLVARISTNDSMSIEMVMSTLREETLKSLRKPPGAKSYRELMGSYIEGRRSTELLLETSAKNLSDTEMQRVMSPRVDTFESNQRSGQRQSVDSKSSERNTAKRKSSENSELNAKKLKPNEIQTQEEQIEVSRILAELENQDFNDDEDEILSQNILAGLENIKVNPKLHDTLDETRSDIGSEAVAEFRFDKSKVNFPQSEELAKSSEDVENQVEKKKKTAQEVYKTKKSNYYAKKFFAPVLHPQSDENSGGKVLAACSDSE